MIEVVHADGCVAAFILDNALYYIRLDIPKIYDENLEPLTIPNIDSWLIAKTQQKCGLSTMKIMADSFEKGVRSVFSDNEVAAIANTVVKTAIREIMQRGIIYDYSLAYWIEVLSSDMIEKYLNMISNKFDLVVDKLGKDRLANELRRIYQVCISRQINAEHVCKSLLVRLESSIAAPIYPDTADIDSKVLKSTSAETLKHTSGRSRTLLCRNVRILMNK